MPRACQVAGPTTPSAVRPCWRWNCLTNRNVVGPKTPSTGAPMWAWTKATAGPRWTTFAACAGAATTSAASTAELAATLRMSYERRSMRTRNEQLPRWEERRANLATRFLGFAGSLAGEGNGRKAATAGRSALRGADALGALLVREVLAPL